MSVSLLRIQFLVQMEAVSLRMDNVLPVITTVQQSADAFSVQMIALSTRKAVLLRLINFVLSARQTDVS